MRILLASHRYLPSIGGTEQAVASLAGAYAARGHDVTVVTSQEPGLPGEEIMEGVRVHRLPLLRVAGFRLARGYLRYLRSEPYDCVHVHGQRVWPSDQLLPFLHGLRGPKVFTPHGFYQWHMEPSWREVLYYRAWFARRLRWFSRVVALTPGEQETLQSWGIAPSRMVIIPQGVNLGEFESARGEYLATHGISCRSVVLYVGGFYPNKRVDLLVRSMASAQVDACLVIAGVEGPTPFGSRYCLQLARELGVDVHYLGPVARGDLLSLYREADVVALPSLFEGFGLVLLEALASGTPFVSTRVGAAPQLAREGGGLVVDDIAAMGPAISHLLSDGGGRKSMGLLGRKTATAYSWERVAGDHLDLYLRLTSP